MMLGALGAAAGAMAWAARGRSSTVFGRSVYRGAARPSVALTFDDGPSESTPQVLDLLDQFSAKATFFQCGANVERLPRTARAVVEAGHELGNHTYSHSRLYLRSGRFIYQELSRAQDTIASVTGFAPVLFRAPYGVRWFGVDAAQQRLNLLGVMWTALGSDWRLPARKIAERLLRGLRGGAILCLHDGRELRRRPSIGETIGALRILLPELAARGYRFETVSQLLCATTSPSV